MTIKQITHVIFDMVRFVRGRMRLSCLHTISSKYSLQLLAGHPA
jgi:hypothetical protein